MLLITPPEERSGPDNELLESLLRRCAAGDREGFAALYDKTRAAVYGFALSILRNAHDAEEICQDTFVRCWQSAGGYRPQGKPLAWLLRIARNLSLNRLKERDRTSELTPEALESLSENPRVTAEDRLTLEALLGTLDTEEREIVVLYAVAGLKHREIAELLDRALPSELSKYNRAVKKLQKAWKEAD